MEWKRDGFSISDDPERLDIGFIDGALQTSYWARGRSIDTIRQSIRNSLCFGVYEGDRQIGFARVVTDQCTFSWVCDVIITPQYRGRGIGTWLMQCVVDHPQTKSTMQILGTKDAHSLYEKVGFVRREMMVRPRPTKA
jgi:GNAT superfamily N-acetyltransferase